MKLSEDLVWRGLIKDKTFENDDWLDQPKTFYLGVDASATSLTVGNLAILLLAKRLAAGGWKLLLVMGGGTSLVGDPGGKSAERQLMSRETVVSNIKSVHKQASSLLQGQEVEIVDNYDWLSNLKYVDFLRDVGKHFSMTELMQRDFVTERMGKDGKGISYAEFSYSLIQGYDFWYLFKQRGVVMQIGGSDQWGNLLSGVALIRKKEGKLVHALSMPLVIDKTTGQKFGKSEGGAAVWLDEQLTPPREFYQFWINANDTEAEQYLKIYTLLPREEIERLTAGHRHSPLLRTVQRRLAYEVTKLVHGEAAAEEAKQYADSLTGALQSADATVLKAAPGDGLVELLLAAGLVSSKTEGRQLLAAKGIYINGRPATKGIIEQSDFVNGTLKLRRGKKLKNTALFGLK